MNKINSPFLIKQDFISPLLCEEIIELIDFNIPDTDIDGKPIKTVKHCDLAEEVLFEKIIETVPDEIHSRYNSEYTGTEKLLFEWFSAGCDGEKPHSENSEYLRDKWVRVRPRDFTGILFLSSYVDTGSLDPYCEVYGGNLEFPQHGFNMQPEMGTLVVFPSVPHFINATRSVSMGSLYQVRMHFGCKTPFLYNPEEFPGDYKTWLLEYI